jgi:hypothetical protein
MVASPKDEIFYIFLFYVEQLRCYFLHVFRSKFIT